MSMISAYNDSFNSLNSLKSKSGQETVWQSGISSQASQLTGSKSEIRSQVEELLSGIPKGADGKLSFQDVDDYREKLEAKWDEEVKADLKKLGVDVDKELPLAWDAANNTLMVSKGHPNKEVIDNYFKSNSDKMDEFVRVIQLGKLTQTHQQKLEPSEIQRNIQQQSVSWWYADNSDPTSWFKGGGKMMGATQATYKGLNIKV